VFLRLIAGFLIFITLSTNLVGCASVSDIRDARNLPGLARPTSNEEFYYDPSIRSYRVKKSGEHTDSSDKGRTIRDAGGKKVQTEHELEYVLQSKKRELVGTGAQITTGVLIVLYLPVIISMYVVESVVMFPWSFMFAHYQRAYEREAEQAYSRGRKYFEDNQIDQALTEWEHARTMMPSLQAFSDIDYWRGRAFQVTDKTVEAQIAYLNFQNYSERSVPDYFKETFPQDPSWEEKAQEVEAQLVMLGRKNSP
jgi:hypothetical protein